MTKQTQQRFQKAKNMMASEPLPRVPLIEIADNKRVLIENHLGVTAYGTDEICVKVRHGVVSITGEKLELLCMSKDKIVICGIIKSIHLWGGRR